MSAEYMRQKTIPINQQSEKQNCFLEAIMKSDLEAFDILLSDDLIVINHSASSCYNYNIFQFIVVYSTHKFIDCVITKYFNMINNLTEGGKNFVPVACERGDKNVLKIILTYFAFASLNDTSSSKQSHNYLGCDKPYSIELTEYKNDIPLSCVIRDNHPDFLLILFKFKSFTFDCFTKEQKHEIFHLCLLAEYRRYTMDKNKLR
ncbi:unnamed protein product [Rotaria socialis]|uniref:Uncharacterized protein n=1 Tax=Rotaria socialis TaxID=392032 RepID=A0A821L2D8_9BILA|nr:unnamed protein product [Rotaria socialis]CAF4744466.1 unnamed protein product [Rotaria socialis]